MSVEAAGTFGTLLPAAPPDKLNWRSSTMALRQVMESYDLLDSATVDGERVAALLRRRGLDRLSVTRMTGDEASTDFVKVLVPGRSGRSSGGSAPTLGIIGRLGGIGGRPTLTGLVSDADGAIAAVASVLKLADMTSQGDVLEGDVIVSTHICPNTPAGVGELGAFMGSPVSIGAAVRQEVSEEMDAILSVDASKGNRILNRRGFAITPTVKEGYVLRVSERLLDLMCYVTGAPPAVLPITTQDITPFENGLHHVNSIVQPSTATTAPVVGVAMTSAATPPGYATGANQVVDLEMAVRFCLEVAKAFGARQCDFYDHGEWSRIQALYGSLRHLQEVGD